MSGGDCGGSCACAGPGAPLLQRRPEIRPSPNECSVHEQMPEIVKESAPISPIVLTTKFLTDIEVDYGRENLDHCKDSQRIAIKYEEIKEENGARWRTTRRFGSGVFSAKIKTPGGDTSGLNCSFYLSSLEGDKTQDEIDFEFLGKDKGIVQTNVYTEGTGNREAIHELGFDSSQEFHEYTIHWSATEVRWLVDGVQVRALERREGEPFPSKPMFLYASVWNAGWVNSGAWAGAYAGCDEPYLCTYMNVQVPLQP